MADDTTHGQNIVYVAQLVASGTGDGSVLSIEPGTSIGLNLWRGQDLKGQILVDTEDFLKFLSGTTEVAAIRTEGFEVSRDIIADSGGSRDIGGTGGTDFRYIYARGLRPGAAASPVNSISLQGDLVPAGSTDAIGTFSNPFPSGNFTLLSATTLDFDNLTGSFSSITVDGVATIDTLNVKRSGEVRYSSQFTSVQAAINDLPSSGGIVIIGLGFSEAGTTTTALTLQGTSGGARTGVILAGKGRGSSTLRPPNSHQQGTPVINAAGSKHRILSLSIDGNKNNIIPGGTGGFGIDCQNSNQLTVEDIEIYSCYNSGIGLSNVNDLRLSKIHTHDNNDHGISHAPVSGGGGVPLLASGVFMEYVLATDNGFDGFNFGTDDQLGGAYINSIAPVHFSAFYCEAARNGRNGWRLDNDYTGTLTNDNFSLVNCWSHDNGTSVADSDGFLIKVDTAGVIFTNFTMERCVAFREAGHGIELRGYAGAQVGGNIRNLQLNQCTAYHNDWGGIIINHGVHKGAANFCTTFENNQGGNAANSTPNIGTGMDNDKGSAWSPAIPAQDVEDFILLGCIANDNANNGRGLFIGNHSTNVTVSIYEGKDQSAGFDLYMDAAASGVSISHVELGTIGPNWQPLETDPVNNLRFHEGMFVHGDVIPNSVNQNTHLFKLGDETRPWGEIWGTQMFGGGANITIPADAGGNITLSGHVVASGMHQVGDFAELHSANVFDNIAQTFRGVVKVAGTDYSNQSVWIHPSGAIEFYDASGVQAGKIVLETDAETVIKFYGRNNTPVGIIGSSQMIVGASGSAGDIDHWMTVEAYKWPGIIFRDTFRDPPEDYIRDFALVGNYPNFGDFSLLSSTYPGGNPFNGNNLIQASAQVLQPTPSAAVDYYVSIPGTITSGDTEAPKSNLDVRGSFGARITPSGYTTSFTAGDYFTILCSGTITATLPVAADVKNRIYCFKQAASGTITIDADGAELIDGSTTFVGLSAQYDSVQLQSDGAQWWIIGGYSIG